jgi:parallel beta-helix repeat protein
MENMQGIGLWRRPVSLALIFLVLTLLFSPFLTLDVVAEPRTLIVPDDYSSIQSAVYSANVGDTIFVRNGTYFENVVVKKALTLVGEASSSTIVDAGGLGSVFNVSADNVRISNFTIQKSQGGYPYSGIYVSGASHCVFTDNIFKDNFAGVLLSSSYIIVLERNLILRSQYGVYLLDSPGNRIVDNSLVSNYFGLVMFSADNCQIIGNDISDNNVGISMRTCLGNRIYHNNFTRNNYQISMSSEIYPNTWDDDYPSGGNYWSDYRGRDLYKGQYQNITGSDGIGDSPYIVKVDNEDRYPYMDPVSVFHDSAVLSVVPSALSVFQGQVLNLSVIVGNVGNYTDSFDVSVFSVKDSNETLIGTIAVANLAAHTQKTVMFQWDTSAVAQGNYTIKAQVSSVAGEKNLANNVLYDGLVSVIEPFHDVAVLSVVPSVLKLYQGQVLNISVIVANMGGYDETFNITVRCDSLTVGQKTVANLKVGDNLTLVYNWNTSNVEPNREYAIRTETSAVPGDVNLDNNVFVDGSVKVRSFALEAIKVDQVVPSDHLGNPVSSFMRGAISYFKVVVNSASTESEIVLVTVNAYDSASASLGVVSFKGLIMPGISVFILGLPIPNTVHLGTAQVYANTFTDWPFAGGLPYGPETSATFQILS